MLVSVALTVTPSKSIIIKLTPIIFIIVYEKNAKNIKKTLTKENSAVILISVTVLVIDLKGVT